MTSSFLQFCKLLQSIREEKNNNSKIELLASYLCGIESTTELGLASRFIVEGAFDSLSGKTASIGSRTIGIAAARFCEIDYDLVFKPCRIATGSNSETIERLIANVPAANKKKSPQNLNLFDVQEFFDKLQSAGNRKEKEIILRNAWSKMSPVEIKYFIHILSKRSLRIGFELWGVIASIATAFNQDKEEVKYVHMITGSISKTAILAKENRLGEARLRLFHPMAFMLASPIEYSTVESFEEYIAEEKLHGIRAQVHIEGGQICIYTRELNDVTSSYPDIVRYFSEKEISSCILDGEICLYKDEKIMPIQLLHKRLKIKKPGKQIQATYPVLFITFDLLFTDGDPIFNKTLTERRKILETVAKKFRIPVAVQHTLKKRKDLVLLIEKALENGNGGLILKHKKSLYEYGQRTTSWLKIKKRGGSFDTIIMYAHAKGGRRSGTYTNFTLGVSVQNDDRYDEKFIPIGKISDGYTDEELQKLNSRIKELTVEKYGPTLGLLPQLVVEIEFDDIQVNKRTKAGYTLRSPRFRSIRMELGPGDVVSLQDVERVYAKKLETEPNPQKVNPSFTFL